MPRCRKCKEKFEPRFKFQKFCDDDKCNDAKIDYTLETVRKQKKKAWNKRKKEMKEGLKPKQDYEKDLEALVNEWVRIRDKDKPCVSCGAPAGTYTLTAGHYWPAGSYKNIRFDLMNINGQCWWNCNKNKSGNLGEYRIELIKRYGEDKVLDLDQRRLSPRKFTIPELKDMIIEYKLKLKSI